MVLPTQKTAPVFDTSSLTVLIYGAQGIGKTTLCSKTPDALFLLTEPGTKCLSVYGLPITSWAEMLEALALVAKGGHQFKTIVVDTVDNAYKFCSDHVCAANGVKDPADLAYGKGFNLVNTEFHRVLTKLASLPYGLMLTSHAVAREVESATGKYTKTTPTLPEGARKILLGFVDVILYADVEGEVGADGKTTFKRIMRSSPSKFYEAKDRTDRLPDKLPLDYATFATALATPKDGDLADQPVPAPVASPAAAAAPAATTQAATPTAQPAAATKPKVIGDAGANVIADLCANASVDPEKVLDDVRKTYPGVQVLAEIPQPLYAALVKRLNATIKKAAEKAA